MIDTDQDPDTSTEPEVRLRPSVSGIRVLAWLNGQAPAVTNPAVADDSLDSSVGPLDLPLEVSFWPLAPARWFSICSFVPGELQRGAADFWYVTSY